MYSLWLIPVLAVVGWRVARRRSRETIVGVRGWLGGMLAIVFLLAGTGAVNAAGLHRWLGHALMVGAWFGVPLAVGAVLQQGFRERRVVMASAHALPLVGLLLLALLGSLTGYLGPSNSDATQGGYEEQQSRFLVAHFIVLPVMLAATLAGEWWLLKPRTDRQSSEVFDRRVDDDSDSEDRDSSNPYQPPRTR